MALTGKTNAEKVYYFFKARGLSDIGAATMTAHADAESGLRPDNVQDACERRVGSDPEYVAKVDSGAYAAFPTDSAGFGLFQLTYSTRKRGFLAYARSKGVSIADMETQLEYAMIELQTTEFSSVLAALKTSTNLHAVSDEVLVHFENPADKSQGVKDYRARLAQQYLDQLGGTEVPDAAPAVVVAIVSAQENRARFIAEAVALIGCSEADGSHRKIIDYYNQHKPASAGFMGYSDPWCAAFVAAVAMLSDLPGSTIPIETYVPQMIVMLQRLGAWEENDAYTPSPGDLIFYDWQDSGTGDNTGTADHVGIVERVEGNTFTVIEGNMGGGVVGRRRMSINAKFIRGFGVPHFGTDTATGSTADTSTFKVGDTVLFTGSVHYADSTAASGPSCKPGVARITAMAPGTKHPYHLIAVAGGGSTVYGWVNASLIQSVATEIAVGDTVHFKGGPVYLNANAATDRGHPAAGLAKVTAIAKTAAHKYHVVHTDSSSIVFGWVDADTVAKEA